MLTRQITRGVDAAPGARSAWLVLLATSVNVVLVFVNATSLLIIMPVVAREFGASPAQATWFLLAYQLVMTSLIVVFGRLADIYGRKLLYIVGVAVFAVGSAMAGLAEPLELFIVARLIQGVGAAAIISNTTAILTDVFPVGRLPAALGLNATSAALGQVLGPVVGGVASEYIDWRLIFLLSAPLSVLSLVASLRLVPGRRGTGRERVDVGGAVALTTSLSLFVAGMSVGSSSGWSGWSAPALLTGSLVAMGAFVLIQARVASPLVDLTLFRVPRLGRRYLAVFLCGFSQYAVILLLSTHLQAVEGLTAFEVSLVVIASPLATMVAAQVVGQLVGRVGVGRLAATGMLLIAAASASLLVLLHTGRVEPWTYVSLVLLGLGIGTFMTPNTSLIMFITPVDRRGVSNGIRSTMLNLGFLTTTAMALAVSTALLDSSARGAVYAGAFPLTVQDQATFTAGVELALGLLVLTAAAGAVLSAGGGRLAPDVPDAAASVPARA